MNVLNIFESIPSDMGDEIFDVLVEKDALRIERIISKGHQSPSVGWYNQEQDEWVIVLQGAAIITFEDGCDSKLGRGDYLHIPAHTKHKVSWTNPEIETIWLAVHF